MPAFRRKLLAWALAFAPAIPLLAADELDVPVVDAGYGMAFYEETARQFEALRPGWHINLYGDPRIEDKICVRIIGGSYPDIASAPYVPWPELIRDGKVLDLTPYLEGPNWEGDSRWRDTFLPASLDSWRMEGRTYGLPFTYSCWSIFYNRRLFREHGWTAPRTWDQFFALCEKIRAAGVAPLSLPGSRWLYADAFLRAAYYNLAGASGWRALNELAPGARLDPRFVRAAETLQRITQNYVLRGWEGETHTGAERSFLEGRAAMTVSGSWLFNEMRGKIPAGFDVGTMNFPVFTDGSADPSAIQTGSDCFFVFSTGDTRKERAAIDFLRFLTSRARAAAFVRRDDAPVAVRGIPIDAYSGQMSETAALVARAREAFGMPQVMLQPPALRQALIDQSRLLTTGRIAPREYARRLEAAAAEDRARMENPERVEVRHPIAGTVLLSVLATVAVGLAAVGRRFRRSAGTPSGDFGRLRAPLALSFVLPSLILYAGLVLLPCATAFAWSFTRWDGIGAHVWAGLFNFRWLLFESDGFWLALRNNLFLMAVPALTVLPLALFFAALIHRGVWGAGVFRVIFLFPNLLGGIAAALLWLNAYEPRGGLVNAALTDLGRVLHLPALAGFDGFPWLAPEHLYAALVPIYLWMACGFNLILYLAAMEGIDPQLYEAAELDGAPKWRQFFQITLPLISDVIAISAVFLVIGGLNAFELVWLLTSQDPGAASHTLGTLLVTTLFKDFQVGRATALAAILFVLVAAGSAAVLAFGRRENAD
jgi:ABC-type sugar transport system permease subunit/ABC-type glycerol-3-phosphate transport system substrate-binding protein